MDHAPSSRHFSTTSQFPSLRSTYSERKSIPFYKSFPKTTPLPQSQTLPCSDSVFTPTVRTVTKPEPYKHHIAADKDGRMQKYYDLSDIRPSVITEKVVEFDRLNFHKVTESDGSVNKYYDLSDIHPKPRTKPHTQPRLTQPITYSIVDLMGEAIEGSFTNKNYKILTLLYLSLDLLTWNSFAL